jgi:hypothetical protein
MSIQGINNVNDNTSQCYHLAHSANIQCCHTFQAALHFNWTTSNASSAGTTQIPNNNTTVLKPTNGFSEVEAVEPSTTQLYKHSEHIEHYVNAQQRRWKIPTNFHPQKPNNIGTSYFSSVQTATQQAQQRGYNNPQSCRETTSSAAGGQQSSVLQGDKLHSGGQQSSVMQGDSPTMGHQGNGSNRTIPQTAIGHQRNQQAVGPLLFATADINKETISSTTISATAEPTRRQPPQCA